MRVIIFFLLSAFAFSAQAAAVPAACETGDILSADMAYHGRITYVGPVKNKATLDNPYYNWELDAQVVKPVKGKPDKKQVIYFTYGPDAFDADQLKDNPKLKKLGAHFKKGKTYRFYIKDADRVEIKGGGYITLLPDCLPAKAD